MHRYALKLEYDGTGFVGWQRQAAGVSIQGLLEHAASHLAAGAAVASVVAGRTDAGVHAEAQVAQIDLPRPYPAATVRDALCHYLKPHPVTVLQAAAVPAEWNARFSATARAYRYTLLNRPSRPALEKRRVWHVARPLDHAAMAAAATLLLGRHDFSSFRAAACQANSPWRTLDRLDVACDADRITIEAEARSFLHHQVRNMAGALKLVGDGSWSVERIGQVLAAADRRAGGPTAPAAGLTLTGVRYPVDPFAA